MFSRTGQYSLRHFIQTEPIIPADDEIASSLRRLQRILRAQAALNSVRKRYLQERTHEALAHAEYRSTLRTLDRPITIAYTKILRAAAAKPGKKGKNKANVGVVNTTEEKISAGGIPLELPPELVERIRLRKRFVDTVGTMLKEGSEDEDEGDTRRKKPRNRISAVHFPTPTLLPPRSIYEGVDEEVEKELGWPYRLVVAGVVEPPCRNAGTGSTASVNGTSG